MRFQSLSMIHREVTHLISVLHPVLSHMQAAQHPSYFTASMSYISFVIPVIRFIICFVVPVSSLNVPLFSSFSFMFDFSVIFQMSRCVSYSAHGVFFHFSTKVLL